MLLSLSVNNYALIDSLSVGFHRGLNIITGETGAGKSILLGALSLIIGKRSDTTALKTGSDKCVVEAEFDITGYGIRSIFEYHDIDYADHTIIRREILLNGKSRAFVNDTLVNLNTLQDLTLVLIDIHSQHSSLLLNEQSYILEIIDRYGNHLDLLKEINIAYNEFRNKELEYLNSLEDYNKIQQEFDFYHHQFTELENAKIKENEISELEEELSQLENIGDIKSALSDSLNLLNGDEVGIINNIKSVVTKLERISGVYHNTAGYLNRFESVKIELSDITSELTQTFEGLEFNPERYLQIKERLDLLNSLMHKHRVAKEENLIAIYKLLKEKINIATDGEFELSQKKKIAEESKQRVNKLAAILSEKRSEVFNILENKIRSVLIELGMQHANIKFDRTQKDLSENGIDDINLLFGANKNHPLQKVSKIASGGELSRLMLAVKSILADSIGMPTLILDEIDTGVSGEIADKVGNIIYNMSGGMQIINITHLPQVASKGKSHYLVYKQHDRETTQTLIKKLNDQERLMEIAKMLSGEHITEAAIENARVLLQK